MRQFVRAELTVDALLGSLSQRMKVRNGKEERCRPAHTVKAEPRMELAGPRDGARDTEQVRLGFSGNEVYRFLARAGRFFFLWSLVCFSKAREAT